MEVQNDQADDFSNLLFPEPYENEFSMGGSSGVNLGASGDTMDVMMGSNDVRFMGSGSYDFGGLPNMDPTARDVAFSAPAPASAPIQPGQMLPSAMLQRPHNGSHNASLSYAPSTSVVEGGNLMSNGVGAGAGIGPGPGTRILPSADTGSVTPSRSEWLSGHADSEGPPHKKQRSGVATPLENLTNNQYLFLLRQVESRLKYLRTCLSQGTMENINIYLVELRQVLEEYAKQFLQLKNEHFLTALDFNNLLSLEEYIHSTLLPQLALYELEYEQITSPDTASPNLAVHLALVHQGNAGPIFKDKPLGPFTLRLLTGATLTQIQGGPVSPEIVETLPRIKKQNSGLEKVQLHFESSGTLTFSDLKFKSGTFPHLISFRFVVAVQVGLQNHRRVIESQPSQPFVSMTNTGSQWKDAAGMWFREEVFKDGQVVTVRRMWNYFLLHYLKATKQEINNIKRFLFFSLSLFLCFSLFYLSYLSILLTHSDLTLLDFDYLLKAKFQVGLDKKMIDAKELQVFWDWIGPSLKKIRYQKHLLWLFENGYLVCFIDRKESETRLALEEVGTFIVRLSERLNGEFVISYMHKSGVRHYLIQPSDHADKTKTIVDFIGESPLFLSILQMTTQNQTRVFYRHEKDKVLSKYYRKIPKKAKARRQGTNPYDTQLPHD